MLETIIHKWLRVPYTLNVHYFSNPNRPKRTILLIHGLGTSWKTWENVASRLPKDYRVVAVDLLGFGNSPTPNWKRYDLKTQAKSIALTLVKNKIVGPLTIVGHSMGALTAIELAKKQYPILPKKLFLCSPPIYRPEAQTKLHHPEHALRKFYKLINKHPVSSKKLLALADKYDLWPDPGFRAEGATAESFLKALSAAIVDQTALSDIEKLKLPITIISGKLDPLIVEANLKKLASQNKNISHARMLTQGHEITDYYAKVIAKKVVES